LPPAGKRRIAKRLRARGWKAFVLDYTDEASIAAASRGEDAAPAGKLDALFNNGAFACPGAVEDLPRGALREIFETNLFGYHDLTRRVIPMMRAQGGNWADRQLLLGARAGRR
jgi:NAD(P)-dependent dehydrogenase (short-subunit alcohol dehydrogenase family)